MTANIFSKVVDETSRYHETILYIRHPYQICKIIFIAGYLANLVRHIAIYEYLQFQMIGNMSSALAVVI